MPHNPLFHRKYKRKITTLALDILFSFKHPQVTFYFPSLFSSSMHFAHFFEFATDCGKIAKSLLRFCRAWCRPSTIQQSYNLHILHILLTLFSLRFSFKNRKNGKKVSPNLRGSSPNRNRKPNPHAPRSLPFPFLRSCCYRSKRRDDG